MAISPLATSVVDTVTKPSSLMSILQPVSSHKPRIVAPPLPITSRILSALIFSVIMRGAKLLTSVFAPATLSCIFAKICKRPSLACASATCMISLVMPWILMSICSAVMPAAVPATLKSMSPKWSSSPKMSVNTANLLPSLIKPIATPATWALMGTPASISAKQPPQTDAMLDEPLDSVISDTTRMAYWKSSRLGSKGTSARFAKRP